MPLLSTLHAIAPAADPSAPGWQAWVQAGAALLAVAVAVAWLTARWLIRRRAGCTGG
jgi:cobalamin synthase